jgi:transcriptional regulator with XRE-family HTH domain
MGAKAESPFVDPNRATQVAEQTARLRSAFGRNLRKARLKRGLTAEAVSVQSGVSAVTLGAIEDGDMDPPLDTMEALARSIGCALQTLLPH